MINEDSLIDISKCVEAKLVNKGKEINSLILLAIESNPSSPWSTFEWQKAKYIIGRCIAECFCRRGCRVYLIEMHGGEPSEGIGDKDLDLAIDCEINYEMIERLESRLESILRLFLSRLVGADIRDSLKIPNIIELHSAKEFLVKKHIHATDQHYVIKLC